MKSLGGGKLDAQEFPTKMAAYVHLLEAFTRLGRLRFSSEWTGEEVSVQDIMAYDEAARLQAELDAERAKLPQHDYESDDDYIAAIIAEDERSGFLALDSVYDDDEFARLIKRICRILGQLSELPPLKDEEGYQAKHQACLRRQAIEKLITELLEQGALVAYHAGPTQREEIPIDKWGARRRRFDIELGSATIGSDVYSRISFPRAEFEEVLRDLAGGRSEGVASEVAARSELISWMAERDRMTKKAARSKLQQEFPTLSERSFNRIWADACRETGSGWGMPGRPKSSQ